MYKVEITSIIKENYPDRYLFLTMIKDGKKSVKVFNTKEFYQIFMAYGVVGIPTVIEHELINLLNMIENGEKTCAT